MFVQPLTILGAVITTAMVIAAHNVEVLIAMTMIAPSTPEPPRFVTTARTIIAMA